ncbi:hypothetical protein [Spirillospora sp. CA-294931]|uniref:hypothetical protein n=1 Tax=Spirillospora sp. CA-294931 TaxID=3240042 RepID=UPI003D934A03
MSLWTSLEPASVTVDPGDSATVRLRVRNTGDVVDEYRFEPVGDVAPWTVVEPATLRLYPGTTGTVELTFSPPRTSDAKAGPNPFAVRIIPTEHPEAVTVPEGHLTITPFTEMRAELVPPTVSGRRRGRPRLAVDNIGNTKLTASVSGKDTGDHLGYEIRPSSAQIEPGRAVFVDLTLRPRQTIWFGSKEQRPYTLSVQRSGVKPVPIEGTFVQRGFLPRWLATFFGVGLALALAFLMLWIAYKPKVRSVATEAAAGAGTTLAPSPSASAPPTAPKKPQAKDKDKQSGGGKSKKPAKPVQVTAATAVNRLAKDRGRHICYRARVAERGWQRPVCDGAASGITGQDKPITGLNVAVSGVDGGVSANAYVHDPASTNNEPKWLEWTPHIENGKDLYIGAPAREATFFAGMGINVGNGQICHVVHFRNGSWGDHVCSNARPDYLFIGTQDNSLWIDAIRLTV